MFDNAVKLAAAAQDDILQGAGYCLWLASNEKSRAMKQCPNSGPFERCSNFPPNEPRIIVYLKSTLSVYFNTRILRSNPS
jgi:hypothetical protein